MIYTTKEKQNKFPLNKLFNLKKKFIKSEKTKEDYNMKKLRNLFVAGGVAGATVGTSVDLVSNRIEKSSKLSKLKLCLNLYTITAILFTLSFFAGVKNYSYANPSAPNNLLLSAALSVAYIGIVLDAYKRVKKAKNAN